MKYKRKHHETDTWTGGKEREAFKGNAIKALNSGAISAEKDDKPFSSGGQKEQKTSALANAACSTPSMKSGETGRKLALTSHLLLNIGQKIIGFWQNSFVLKYF